MGTASPRGGHGTHDLNRLDAGQPAPPPPPRLLPMLASVISLVSLTQWTGGAAPPELAFVEGCATLAACVQDFLTKTVTTRWGSRMAAVEGTALPGLWSHLGATPWPCSCLQWPSPRLPPKPRWWGGAGTAEQGRLLFPSHSSGTFTDHLCMRPLRNVLIQISPKICIHSSG